MVPLPVHRAAWLSVRELSILHTHVNPIVECSIMLERLTKTPEYRVFWVITSARAVLTAAMSVGAEILEKYRTKLEVFKY